MGYTHSTYRPLHLDHRCFAAFAADVKKLIWALPVDVRVRGGDGTGEPTVTGELVEFNGDGTRGMACEAFQITRDHRPDLYQRPREGRLFVFTKTQGLPYDVLVVAAMFALIHHCPEVEFHSDGTREALRPGLDLFIRACEPDLGGRDLLGKAITRDGAGGS